MPNKTLHKHPALPLGIASLSPTYQLAYLMSVLSVFSVANFITVARNHLRLWAE